VLKNAVHNEADHRSGFQMGNVVDDFQRTCASQLGLDMAVCAQASVSHCVYVIGVGIIVVQLLKGQVAADDPSRPRRPKEESTLLQPSSSSPAEAWIDPSPAGHGITPPSINSFHSAEFTLETSQQASRLEPVSPNAQNDESQFSV
jgi:hypothetical protein